MKKIIIALLVLIFVITSPKKMNAADNSGTTTIIVIAITVPVLIGLYWLTDWGPKEVQKAQIRNVEITEAAQKTLIKAESEMKYLNYDSAEMYYKQFLNIVDNNKQIKWNEPPIAVWANDAQLSAVKTIINNDIPQKKIAFEKLDPLTRGETKMNVENYSDAIINFDKTIELDPKSWKAYKGRGVCKRNLNNFTDAIQDLNKAYELNSKEWSILSARGECKASLSDFTGAVNDYNIAIIINSSNAYMFGNRGNAKYELKDYAGAIKDFSKAIEFKPLNYLSYCYKIRGLSKYKLGERTGALEDLSKSGELGDTYAYELIKRINNDEYESLDGFKIFKEGRDY